MLFDGRKSAKEKEEQLKKVVSQLAKAPKLVAIQVGHNPASDIYLRLKREMAERIGIEFELVNFPEDAKEEEIIEVISSANKDEKVKGIMVQLPLPKEFNEFTILQAIDPKKDVDCLTMENLGLVIAGEPRFFPATVKAVLEILEEAGVDKENLVGKNACIVGGSNIVGKPLALVLSNMGATISLCRSKTKDLAQFTTQADILVTATGVEGIIKEEMVKEGVIVIDVGAPKAEVDFENVNKKTSFITPVPGGVGPMTVVCLMENLVQGCK